MNKKVCNIVLIGGLGRWSEINHIPNILAIKDKYPGVKVVGICDLFDPYTNNKWRQPNLRRLLATDAPLWLTAPKNNLDWRAFNELHKTTPIDLMVIACNPVHHYSYAVWALRHGVSIVCDKPLVDVVNAASDYSAARAIQSQYDRLVALYNQARKKTPLLTFNLLLRRRSLPAFTHITDRLRAVAQKYGAGINHVNMLSHNGIYKYPAELLGNSAHSFSDGVGALSHSSYHYIDLFNQYLRAAPGDIAYVVPRLTNIFRINDYLIAQSYRYVAKVNNEKVVKLQDVPNAVLACELDYSFHFVFFDQAGRPIGDGNFINNHVSFSPRTRKDMHGISDPADFYDGGRTSHVYIDIHQSGLQNIELIKNDVAMRQHRAQLHMRTHPHVRDFSDVERIRFDNAYKEADYSLKDLLGEVIVALLDKRPVQNEHIVNLKDDAANVQLFSRFYELIACDYSEPPDYSLADAIKIK